jgi:hypothetical protein
LRSEKFDRGAVRGRGQGHEQGYEQEAEDHGKDGGHKTSYGYVGTQFIAPAGYSLRPVVRKNKLILRITKVRMYIIIMAAEVIS